MDQQLELPLGLGKIGAGQGGSIGNNIDNLIDNQVEIDSSEAAADITNSVLGEVRVSKYKASQNIDKINIKETSIGDDYAAMKQVVSRRYTRIKKEDGKLPDLILIDGGKGQISSTVEIMKELQLESIKLVGVAKGPERKPGQEVLIISDGKRELRLPANSAVLHLIQEIRDEAHRFAITGHRQRRKKVRNHSVLEEVEGVGAKRRQQLIRHFGGLQGIARAGVKDLAKVVGINKNLAQKIYDVFH